MYYYAFSRYLKERFGTKVRRLGLNAGFPCPDRGSSGPCIFCNQEAFSLYADSPGGLPEQIERSMKSARERWGAEKFIAYFQNSTSTNASLPDLKEAFDVIKAYDDIVALSVSTRPDCVDSGKLRLLASYLERYDVWLEYGLQSLRDRSLEWLRRGHTGADTERAVRMASDAGISVAVHVMLGIPGENEEEVSGMARRICELPIRAVKLHLLHVLKGTALESMYDAGDFQPLTLERYARLVCGFLEALPSDVIVMRIVSDAREGFLVAPDWMRRKQNVIAAIDREFRRRGTRQGAGYEKVKAPDGRLSDR